MAPMSPHISGRFSPLERGWQVVGLLCCALALLVHVSPARAGDKASAESLFREGKQLMKDGNVDEACRKFEASWQADPAIGALLNLALCHQKQGKTASAWAEFTQAASIARRSGDEDRARGAQEHADKLEPRLSYLTISVAQPPPELAVQRNGEDVAEGSLGTAVAVDPGAHEIVATAPGYTKWSTSITVGANGDRKAVQIPPLEPGAADEPPPPAGDGEPSPAQGIAGWTFLGVGAAGLAVGAVLGIVATVQVGELEDPNCPDKECNLAGQEERDDAEAIANGSTAMFIIGGVFAATGLVLLLTDDSGDDAGTDELSAALLPALGPTGAGLTLTGTF